MADPRYVATFRPGSPEMVAVAIVALLGAVAAVAISVVARSIACGESSGDCDGGTVLVVIASVGLLPTLGMVAESSRRRGPWYWFLGAALVYAFWTIAFAAIGS
jgi:hypothetical protein